MGYNHLRIKQNAKKHYSLNTGRAILVSLILVFLGGGGGGSYSSFTRTFDDSTTNGLHSLSPEELGFAAGILIVIAIIGIFAIFLSIFIFQVIRMGSLSWFQKSIHTEKLSVGAAFGGFSSKFLDNVLTMFLKSLFIFLWSLLLIIPGIVMSYAYSMTEYIKMENPNISPSRAIELSKAMTQGRKGNLFYLDLSFIGWNLLSALTLGI